MREPMRFPVHSRSGDDDGIAPPPAAASVRVWSGRIEIDGVTSLEPVLLAVDVHAQGTLDDVDELDARMVVGP